MFGRKPSTAGRNVWLMVCAAVLALATGCAGWRTPRIDPTGERFLVWPNEFPTAGALGPTAETLSGQIPLTDPSAASSGNVQAAPAWPSSGAPSVFPNGFHWQRPRATAVPSGPMIGTPLVDPCSPLFDPCTPQGETGWSGGGLGLCNPFVHAAPTGIKPQATLKTVDQIVLAPKRLLAPVGSEVILRAGICTKDGHLISNQRIEWLLASEGVGEFVTVGEPHWMHPLTRPKKVDNHYALGRTSGKAFTIDRGTVDPSDDVPIRDGETWISVTSPIEGTSLVTAVAKDVENWKRRKTTASIHWIDAQWIFPKPASIAAGTQHRLTTTVTRRTDGGPISGWTVRYEMLDRGAAGFAPDGAEAVEATTNANGEASVEIFQADRQVPSARVAIQVIRAPLPGSNERLILGSGATSVTWSSPDIAINSTGPSTAAVGSTLSYQINVTNPGAATASDVVVTASVPAGMAFVQSRPTASKAGRQIEWSLGDIGSREVRTISVDYRVERAGSFEHCAMVRTADGLRSEHCTRTDVLASEAVLELKLTGPLTATVGDLAPFQVVVVNRGTSPATGLMITDRFDTGFEHPGDTENTYQIQNRDLADLQPGQASRPITIEFTVVAAGRICHEVEVTGDGGLLVKRTACVEVRERAGGPSGVIPLDAPPQGATIDITKQSPRQARVGDKIITKIFAKNTGDVDLHNVQVEEVFPSELEPLRATEGKKRDGQTLRWTIERLPAGQNRLLEVEYKCVAPTNLNVDARTTATISVGSLVRSREAFVEILPDTARTDSGGAGVPPPAGPRPNIELTLSSLNNPARVGERSVYIVSIVNKGQASDRELLLNVVFPLEMAPDMTRINDTLRIKNIQASRQGQTVRFTTIREIRPGEPIELTLSFNATRPATVKVLARLTSESLSQPLIVEEQTEIVPR